MGRFLFVGGLACLVLGLVATPAVADDDASLKQEVEKLRQEVQVMRTSMLEKEIDSYLSENQAWRGAQGDGLGGVTIHASFTAVFQGTLGQSDNGADDVGVLDGDVDLQFDFQVTDNLDLFIHLTANNGGSGTFPSQYFAGPVSFSPTLAGLTDGIGVNGTVPTDPGEVALYEAGIRHGLNVGDNKLYWEAGALDPRTRFLQNAFADDENTQFIHNTFDDSAAVMWLTDSTGRTSLGWYFWISFGGNKEWTLSWGYFNTPGQWFSRGQFYAQLAWKGQVNGRDMNIRLMGWYQEFFTNSVDDNEAGGGLSWDWMATDQIGVFIRIAVNGADINPVELDGSAGVVFMGVFESRPDDVIGFAAGFLNVNDNVISTQKDTEFTFELYYKWMAENGKLQITPHLIFVSDPGGGSPPFAEDNLFIMGIRIYVPF